MVRIMNKQWANHKSQLKGSFLVHPDSIQSATFHVARQPYTSSVSPEIEDDVIIDAQKSSYYRNARKLTGNIFNEIDPGILLRTLLPYTLNADYFDGQFPQDSRHRQ